MTPVVKSVVKLMMMSLKGVGKIKVEERQMEEAEWQMEEAEWQMEEAGWMMEGQMHFGAQWQALDDASSPC